MALAYWFSPPSRLENRLAMPRRGHPGRLFPRLRVSQGLTLLRFDGLYRLVEHPRAEDITEAEVAFLGGHIYLVSPETADELVDAGYGDGLVEANVYGSGPYGEGPYG